MRLVTYNMRKAVGLDWNRNPGRVLEVINALEADVIVLQEADRRLGPRASAIPHTMFAQYSDFTPANLAKNDVSLGFHGNAILVRREHKMANAQRIGLPGLEPRGAVSVDINGTLRVVGVHLGLLRRHRCQQLASLAQTLRMEQNQIPTAILGDFNEWSQDKGLENLKPEYSLHAPGRTFHAARPVAALDRVALSHGLKLLDAGVDESPLARVASDHLPIWADLET